MAQKKCDYCYDMVDETLVSTLDCAHVSCPNCLHAIFKSYPAVCCRRPNDITMERAAILRAAAVEEHIKKRKEQESEDKLYCSNPRCSAFIHWERVFGENAICPACQSFSCAKCGQAYHVGKPCETDQKTIAVKDLAVKEGWKFCPSCNHLIERVDGCRHMDCPCGMGFCYECGKDDVTCLCSLNQQMVNNAIVADEDDPAVTEEDRRLREFENMMDATTGAILERNDLDEMVRVLQELTTAQATAHDRDESRFWYRFYIEDLQVAIQNLLCEE